MRLSVKQSAAFNLKLKTNFQITKKSEKGLPKNLSFHTIQQDPTTSFYHKPAFLTRVLNSRTRTMSSPTGFPSGRLGWLWEAKGFVFWHIKGCLVVIRRIQHGPWHDLLKKPHQTHEDFGMMKTLRNESFLHVEASR